MGSPARRLRVLIAKPGLDGHDRGARVVASALRDAGFEVVYTGLRASVPAIAAAAVQEDVDVIGLSILSGAHLSLCGRLVGELKKRGAHIPVVVGGIIPEADHARLTELGVSAVFGPESPLEGLTATIERLARGEPVAVAAVPARPAPARPALRGLDHLAVAVTDLDRATEIFERLLGWPPAHREYVEAQRTEAVFFELGGGGRLELIAPRGGNPGLEKFLEKRGPGLHHLALRVEGLAEGLAALEAEGLTPIDRQPRPGAHGTEVAFLRPGTTAGVLVELVEERGGGERRRPDEGLGGDSHEDAGVGGDTGAR